MFSVIICIVAFVAMMGIYSSTLVGGDEGRYILDASRIKSGEVPVADYTTRTPILLYGMYASVKIFGSSLFAFRLPVMIFSALTATGVFLLGSLLFSRTIGVLAGLLFALQPLTLWQGVVVKSEALTILCTVYAAIMLILARKHNRVLFWIFAGVFLGFGYIERPSVVAFIPALFYLIAAKPLRTMVRPLALVGGGFLCGFGVWFGWVAYHNSGRAIELWLTPFLLNAVRSAKELPAESVGSGAYGFVRDWLLAIVENMAVQSMALVVGFILFCIGVGYGARRSMRYSAWGIAGIITLTFFWHSALLIQAGYFHPYIFLAASSLGIIFGIIGWCKRRQLGVLAEYIHNHAFEFGFLVVWISGLFLLYSLFLPGYTREFMPALALISGALLSFIFERSSRGIRISIIFFLVMMWCIGGWWFIDHPRTGGWWWQQSTVESAAQYLRKHTYPQEEIFAAGQLPVIFADRRVFLDLNSYSVVFAEDFKHPWGTFPSPERVLRELEARAPRFVVVDGRMKNHFFDKYPVFQNFVEQKYERVEQFGSGKRRDWIEIWRRKTDISNLEWSFKTGGEIEGSPKVDLEGTIYVGSEDGALYAVSHDGSMRWKYETGGPIIRSSPAITTDNIYIGSDDGKMYAFRKDGSLRWTFMTDGPVRSSPIVVNEMVLFGSLDGTMYALDRNSGEELWRFKTQGPIVSSPVVDAEAGIYVTSEDHFVYAIDLRGIERWRFDTGAFIFSSPAVGNDSVYVGSEEGVLYALTKDGVLSWKFRVEGGAINNGIESSPLVGENSTIYFGSKDHRLYAVNKGGEFKWAYRTGWEIESSPRIGSDGMIYVGSEDYRLHRISKEGEGSFFFVTNGQVDSSALVHGGIIYFGSQDGFLYAVRMGNTR
ncbi:MAG: PQQ-binding-like beta-propeller repeat protein [Patescibacteria group bacterium]